MARLAGGDDVIGAIAMQLAPLARQLDCALAGLGTTVEQVSLVAARAPAQLVDERQQAATMKTRPGVDQRLRLVGQGLDQHAGAVAQAVDRATLGEIQIGVPLVIPQPGALPTYEHLRCPLCAWHQPLARQGRSQRLAHERALGLGDHRGRSAQVEQVHRDSSHAR